ncbi:MAG TPA: Hpt domain-containing protein, partial [Ottowia sp.]|nr:Hpt domain-containing protein [Ottowia sp.]
MSPAVETGAQGAPIVRDLGPLAWVLDEARKSIESASKSLKRFAREAEGARGIDLGSVDASPLRMARQQLHQVAGALEMVDQPAAAQTVRGMEGAVQQFVQRPDKCTEAAAQTLEQAGFALIEYLEAQLGERPRSALGLFPQYRQVQQLAGADRIHPADLWSMPWRWADPAMRTSAQPLSYGAEVRARLDQRVLKLMRHADINAAAELGVITAALASGQTARQPAVFWTLAAGFFEALGHALIQMDVCVKRAASRILIQYTSLAQGSQAVSERLAHDLLFFCTQARPDPRARTPALDAVRKAWALEAEDAAPYEQATFGLYDPAVLAQARRRVEAVKENWSTLAGGDMARTKACVDQFSLVAESLDKLHHQGHVLGAALNGVAQQIAQSGRPPGPELAMETATAVLFLEASFADFQPGDMTFSTRLGQLAERLDAVRAGALTSPLEPWMEELYRNVSDRQTMGTVVGELRTTLGEVEQHLDQFFRNPAERAVLAPVPALMGQMRGVLSVLGLDQAALAVGRLRDVVDELMASEPDSVQADGTRSFEKLGNSLGALGFQIDMLSYQPVLARKLFVYDATLGELRHVAGRATPAGPVVDKPATEPGGVDLLLDDVPGVVVPMSAPAALLDERLPPESISGQLDEIAAMAALADKPALANAAQRAADAARRQDEAGLTGALDALQAIAGAATPKPVPAPAEDAPSNEDDLLDIFLEEACEVVDAGDDAVRALSAEPGDLAVQTTLRRAFHTLKGSSRMVGLAEFGEAAWAMEQLLNAWLPEQKPVTEALRGLASEALQGFRAWTEAIARRDAAGWSSAPFRLAADAWRLNGQRIPLRGGPQPLTDASTDEVAAHVPTVEAAVPDQAALAPPDGDAALGLPSIEGLELPDLALPSGRDTPADLPVVASSDVAVAAPALDMIEPDAGATDERGAPLAVEVIDLSATELGTLSETLDPAWLGAIEIVEAPQ